MVIWLTPLPLNSPRGLWMPPVYELVVAHTDIIITIESHQKCLSFPLSSPRKRYLVAIVNRPKAIYFLQPFVYVAEIDLDL